MKTENKFTQNFLAMARGTLVIDECVQELAPPLEKRNIHVIVPHPEEDDDLIIKRLLPNRIIVTKNPNDFKRDASSYDIGIIDVSKLKFIDSDPDPVKNKTVKIISDAIMDFSLWSKRHGFIITLYNNKKAVFKELTN